MATRADTVVAFDFDNVHEACDVDYTRDGFTRLLAVPGASTAHRLASEMCDRILREFARWRTEESIALYAELEALRADAVTASQASEPAPEASGPAPSRARAVEIISTALADFMQRTTLVHGVDPRELLDPASGLEEESTWLALPGPMEGNARPGHSR